MEDNRSYLMNYAMRCGLILGAFWVLKYLVFMSSIQYPMLSVAELLLRIITPTLLLTFLVRYRTKMLGGVMSYWHGVQFSILLFFFAAVIEALIIFVHITWINPDFIATFYANFTDIAKTLGFDQTIMYAIESQPIPTPASYVWTNIMSNVFSGLLLGLIIVPLSRYINPQPKN